MSQIKRFCVENNITSYADGKLFLDGCGFILSFLREFDLSYTEEDFHYVKALHDGTNPEMVLLVKQESEEKWFSSLQEIKLFPTFSVLMEFKHKIEDVIDEWLNTL